MAFSLEIGTVMGCPVCEFVMMEFSKTADSYLMDLGGLRSLRITH